MSIQISIVRHMSFIMRKCRFCKSILLAIDLFKNCWICVANSVDPDQVQFYFHYSERKEYASFASKKKKKSF